MKAILSNPVQRAMLEATPDRLMADIVNDQRRGVTPPSSMAAAPNARAEPRKGTGWVDSAPLKPPPGVDILDRMMDAQDAKDRSELVARMQAAQRQAAIDVAWEQRRAEQELRRDEAERRSFHKAPGDPDFSG
jgi:hypothetical protein